jgi:hypothetical protein
MMFNMGGAAMTIVPVDRLPATRVEADPKSFPDDLEYLTGFVETARLLGLRLAGYEAWAAGICALVAVGCLVGVTWVVVALMAPAIEVVVPTGCGSIDCSLQTVLMP